MELSAWTAKLLVTAALLGGYPMPPTAPVIHCVPAAEIAARFCGGSCAARGAYLPGEGVMLSTTLEIDTNPSDRAVLLHELVHYLQDINGRFADETRCDRFIDRETEAYAVEDRYLARYNLGVESLEAAWQVLPPGCTLPTDQ